jgi:hypothetical protein
MKKIITSIILIACVALCAAVWQHSAEVGDLPADAVKTTVKAEIEAWPEKAPHIFIRDKVPTPAMDVVTESNSPETELSTLEIIGDSRYLPPFAPLVTAM